MGPENSVLTPLQTPAPSTTGQGLYGQDLTVVLEKLGASAKLCWRLRCSP